MAKCTFCARPLVRIDGAWWCTNTPCAQRQIAHATWVDRDGVREWLYVPSPKQALWHEATYNRELRRILVGGAAAPGKSRFLREVLYAFAQRIPGGHFLLLRKTHKDLDQSHVRFMPHEVESRGGRWFGGDTRVARFYHDGKPDAIIRTGHLEDINAIENYLSSEYDIICPDELVTFDREVMLELFTRARTTNDAMTALRGDRGTEYDGAFVLSASNPGGRGGAWVKDFFIDQAPDPQEFPGYDRKIWAFYPAYVRDNPYLSVRGYEESLSNLRESRKRQLLDGDWTVFEGQYFDNFKPKTHVRDLGALSPDLKRFLGLDWGLNSPGCCVWIVCLPDGHYHIEAEYKFNGDIGAKKYVKDVAAEIRNRCKNLGLSKVPPTFVDPDICADKGQGRGQTIAETFIRWRVPAIKADNDRVNGWMRVYEMFRPAPDGTPWLTVDPSCRYLIRTLPMLTTDKNKPEDINTDLDDHGADALRYACMSRTAFNAHKPQADLVPYSPAWFRAQGAHVNSSLLGAESL